MKTFKLGWVLMAVALVTLGLAGSAMAFHSSGVAQCAGCHTMHNSQDGVPMTATPGDYLMKGGDPSSTCLSCHAEYGQMTKDGSGWGSGGDFYWLTKTYSWSAHGRTSYSYGDSHGHNIIAKDFGLMDPDQTLSQAPGGSYSSTDFSCASCHDPHGKEGNVLLLYGTQKPGFTAGAPVLKTLSRRTTVGQSGRVSDTNHVAYSSGVSNWCANCHTDFLDSAGMHPVNEQLGSTIKNNYNSYVSTGVGGGNPATSYWEIVPFETKEAVDVLDNARTAGPETNSQVMCLSCHRAHATAFQDSGKWDFTASHLEEESHPLITDTGASQNDVDNKYYGRTFTLEQRSLCNKCHVQD